MSDIKIWVVILIFYDSLDFVKYLVKCCKFGFLDFVDNENRGFVMLFNKVGDILF